MHVARLVAVIIVAGVLFVDPAHRGEYLARTWDVAVHARASAGCLDFVQAADPVDPARINVFERWETDADVEAFRASGSAGDPGPKLPPIRGAEVQKYRIASVESP